MFRRFQDNKYTQISLYVVIVAFLIIAFNAFVDNIPYFFRMLIERVKWIVNASKPLIIAIVFAYLFDPVVTSLERIFAKVKFLKKRHMCRILASLTVALGFVSIILVAVSIFVFSITDNFRFGHISDLAAVLDNYRDSINEVYNGAIEWLYSLDIESPEIQNNVQDVAKTFLDYFKIWTTSFASSIGNFASFVATSVIAIVMTIYLMIDGKMIMSTCDRVFKALFSDKLYRKMHYFMDETDKVFSGYIRGQCIDAVVMMGLISITLSILDFDFSLLVGIAAGIGNLIPYVGPFIAYGGVIILTLFSGEWSKCLIAIICLFIIQTIDGNIIGPKLLSNSIKVHPLLVIVCIVFGSAIGGLFGMLLAVPIGALIKILFMNYIDGRLEMKEARKEIQASVELPKKNETVN